MANRFVYPIIMFLGVVIAGTALTHLVQAATITSSALSSIQIYPNDRPTVVDELTDQQFVATGYTADGQVLGGITFEWSVGEGIGRITKDGIFTAEKPGIGTVTAKSGNITASVGVVVKDVPGVSKNTNTAPIPPSSTNTANVNGANANTNSEAVNTNTATEETNSNSNVNEAPSAVTEEEEDCTTINGWIWILIFFAYTVLLFVYFISLGDSKTMWWWVWPLVVTAGLLLLYNAIRCSGVQLWVPWVLVGIGLLMALFYIRVLRPKEYINPTSSS